MTTPMFERETAEFDTACTQMHDHTPSHCTPGLSEGKPLHVVHNTSATHCANCGQPFGEERTGFLLAAGDDEAVCTTCSATLDAGGHRAIVLLNQIEDGIDDLLEQDDMHDLHAYLRGIARGAAWLLAEFAGGDHILAATEPPDPDQF